MVLPEALSAPLGAGFWDRDVRGSEGAIADRPEEGWAFIGISVVLRLQSYGAWPWSAIKERTHPSVDIHLCRLLLNRTKPRDSLGLDNF